MKTLTIALLFFTASFTLAGEIFDYYLKQKQENRKSTEEQIASWQKSRSREEIASTNHGITEIGIERSGCFGECPMYTLVVKGDGAFRYKGDQYVERKGEFSGTIPIWHFHELARFIRDSGYMGFEDAYRRSVTDHPTTYTSVVVNGKRKVISNYADAGPTTLWAIEQLIDDLMAKATWNPSRKSDARKK